MDRTALMGAALVVLAAASWLILAGGQSPTTVTVTDSFEDGLDAWRTGTHLPLDPNTPAPNDTVDWSIATTDRVAATGNTSALFTIDGSQDDGTVWLHREIPVQPGHRYDVTVAASAWSEMDSFNHLADMMLYAGTEPPRAEQDFPQSNSVSTDGPAGGLRKPLHAAAGWKTYNVTWTAPPGTDTVHVAVGMSVVWETVIAVPYDDITVTVEPRD